MAENGIASSENFRKAAEARKADLQVPERVVLPKSGHAVVLRRPTPMWFLFHGRLPMSLAAKRSDSGGAQLAAPLQSAEQFIEFANWIVDLLREVFVGPKLSLHPGTGEISPDWLAEEDLNFIMRWAVGEVTSEGSDLGKFRGGASGPAPAPGAVGGDLSLSSQ